MTLTPDTQTTVVGGALAVLLLREVFGFVKVLIVKDRRATNGAGDKSVEFWQETQRRIIREELQASYVAALSPMTEHLAAIRGSNRQIAESLQAVALTQDQIVRWVERQEAR